VNEFIRGNKNRLSVIGYRLSVIQNYWEEGSLPRLTVCKKSDKSDKKDWLTASWSEGWAVGRENISSSESMEHRFPPVAARGAEGADGNETGYAGKEGQLD